MKDVLNQSSAPTTSFKETYVPPRDSTSDEALTAIVISQRERFRIRNVELENVKIVYQMRFVFDCVCLL